jgi:pimeloyl-ACP methyl ester carboxylesterase
VVWGRHDRFIPVAHVRHQLVTFPNANVVILERSGHWPYADDPDATRAALMAHFARGVGSEDRSTHLRASSSAPEP